MLKKKCETLTYLFYEELKCLDSIFVSRNVFSHYLSIDEKMSFSSNTFLYNLLQIICINKTFSFKHIGLLENTHIFNNFKVNYFIQITKCFKSHLLILWRIEMSWSIFVTRNDFSHFPSINKNIHFLIKYFLITTCN